MLTCFQLFDVTRQLLYLSCSSQLPRLSAFTAQVIVLAERVHFSREALSTCGDLTIN